MTLDTAAFDQARRPSSIGELLNVDALADLLKGYSYRVGAGVSVIGREPGAPVTVHFELGFVRSEAVRPRPHPFCVLYRRVEEQDRLCRSWYSRTAERYFDGECSDAMLFRCQCQLWNMAFPLRVNGSLLAVLFAGQKIVEDHPDREHEAYQSLRGRIHECDQQRLGAQQTADVMASLSSVARPDQVAPLEAYLGSGAARTISVARWADLWEEFQQFGESLVALLEDLYWLRVNLEGRRLLQQVGDELSLTNPETFEYSAWWANLDDVARAFAAATDAGRLRVFVRKESRFELRVDTDGMPRTAPVGWNLRIPARLLLSTPCDEFVPIPEPIDPDPLFRHLGLKGTWAMRVDQLNMPGQRGSGSTILIVSDRKPTGVVLDFCHEIALRAQLGEAMARTLSDRREFEDRVAMISHSAKTPLQRAITRIEWMIENLGGGSTDQVIRGGLQEVRADIWDVQAELRGIYSPTAVQPTDLELRLLVERILRDLKPQADERGCILRLEAEVAALPVRALGAEIRVALLALIDNAIKYSRPNSEVMVKLQTVPGNRAEVKITNYGLGIPDDRRDRFLLEGDRQGLRSSDSPGSGLGLPIALDALERNGGTLDLRSRPVKGAEPNSWTDCVTDAIVTLPLEDRLSARRTKTR